MSLCRVLYCGWNALACSSSITIAKETSLITTLAPGSFFAGFLLLEVEASREKSWRLRWPRKWLTPNTWSTPSSDFYENEEKNVLKFRQKWRQNCLKIRRIFSQTVERKLFNLRRKDDLNFFSLFWKLNVFVFLFTFSFGVWFPSVFGLLQ